MKRPWQSRFLHWFALITCILTFCGMAAAAPPYIITNDDETFPFTGVSFFSQAASGNLTFQKQVATVGTGIGGGFFGANRISVLNSGGQACVFASEAATHSVIGINVNTLAVGGSATGADSDDGSGNGIGLTGNAQFLYAAFVDSNTVGTFQVQSGCGVLYVNSIPVSGVEGGFINGMANHGNMLIATYTDGTIESFDISNGTPVSNRDKQISTATIKAKGATYPNSVDITSDGHFAIFGDTSTSLSVEVSDLSSGKLAKTKVFTSTASISASNIMLSPDETILYVVNSQGDAVTALFFNKAKGKLTAGCTSSPVRGYSRDWSYLVGVALASQTGNGGGVYIAEFPAGIALVKLKVSGTTCTLKEVSTSPFDTPNTSGLLSIGAYPPRAF
jgi:hypothetical protein